MMRLRRAIVLAGMLWPVGVGADPVEWEWRGVAGDIWVDTTQIPEAGAGVEAGEELSGFVRYDESVKASLFSRGDYGPEFWAFEVVGSEGARRFDLIDDISIATDRASEGVDITAREEWFAISSDDGASVSFGVNAVYYVVVTPTYLRRTEGGVSEVLVGSPFQRGDVNADGALDISDPIGTLLWLFAGTEEPACLDAADTDDSGDVDLSDAVLGLRRLFLGAAVPEPSAACGADPTVDPLGCEVSACTEA